MMLSQILGQNMQGMQPQQANMQPQEVGQQQMSLSQMLGSMPYLGNPFGMQQMPYIGNPMRGYGI